MKRGVSVACVIVLAVVLLLSGGIGPGASAGAARPRSTQILAVEDSPYIVTQHNAVTISMEVSSAANIKDVYFTFCQLTDSVCYLPITMALTGANWYVGSTLPMTSYPGMKVGVHGGFNITINYDDGTNGTEPSMPNQFHNLSIAQTVTGEYMFVMVVSNPAYGLTGQVVNDTSGASIPGAIVTVSPGNNTTVTTNSAGAFSFPYLVNGTYTLSATATGYQSYSTKIVISGQDVVQNVRLTSPLTTNHKGSGSNGSGTGFFGTTLGMVSVAVVIVVVVLIGAALLLWTRRRKAASPAPTNGTAGPPSGPGPKQG
jgi:hypothetical protein